MIKETFFVIGLMLQRFQSTANLLQGLVAGDPAAGLGNRKTRESETGGGDRSG